MKKIVLLLTVLAITLSAYSTKIFGTIKDKKGNPIEFANVFIKDSYAGATSNAKGEYQFDCFETGKVVFIVRQINYEEYQDSFDLSGKELQKDVVLKLKASKVERIVVSSGAFEASDEKKGAVLSSLDVVTTAGANGDLYSALETLPGTQSVGESEGLFVRGGTAEETVTIIDGMVVNDPYFSSVPNIPQRGRFSPFSFKGTVFSTGGYSAQYGQALSAAVILESIDMPQITASNIGITPVGINGGHTQSWKKTALGVYGGYTHLGAYFWLFPQRVTWVQPPETYNANVIFRQKTSETGIFKLSSNYSRTRLRLFPNAVDAGGDTTVFGSINNNLYVNASWKEYLGKSTTLFIGGSFSKDVDDIEFGGAQFTTDDQYQQGKAMITKSFKRYIKLKVGGELHSIFKDFTFKPNPVFRNKELMVAGFTEVDFNITPKVAVRLGGRVENSQALGDDVNLAPRASLAVKTGKYSQANAAFGHFYQTPRPNRDENIFDFYSQMPNLTFEKAEHYIVNYQYFTEKITFRVEAYNKEYKDLLKFETAGSTLNFSNLGEGYSRGFDLFFRDKKSMKNSDYWISYSFIDTKREFRDFPSLATPTFAAKHNASVVYKRFIPKLRTSFGGTYAYSSGRPYYNPNNPVYLGDKTPDYHNFSINASYLTRIKGNFTVIFASLGNVFGFDNIYGYTYDNAGNRSAIKSPVKRQFFVGVFISLMKPQTPETEDN